jgi:hypothetical protein
MAENEAQPPITFSEELFQAVCHAREMSIGGLLLDDESPSGPLSIQTSRKFKRKTAWIPLIGRRPVFPVFLHCLLGCGAMQSSFAHILFLALEGAYVRAFAEVSFKAFVCILTMPQVTMPNGREMQLPEPKPQRLYIRPILEMWHP